MMRPICSVLICLGCAAASLGQEVWYLSPRDYHVEPAIAADVRVVRTGGRDAANANPDPLGDEALIQAPAFPTELAAHVFVRGGGKQWNLHHPEPIEVGSVWTNVPMPEVGAAMIGLACDPVIETFSAEQLRSFIEQHAPAFDDIVIPQRDEIRVRVVRCAKALVRVDDGKTEGMASPIPSSKAGQRSEIRLNGDPTVLDVANGEAEIPLRLYADWHSRKGVTFTVANTDTGVRTVVDVNEYGNGPMVVDRAGVWQVEFHYFVDVRSEEDEGTAAEQGTQSAEPGEQAEDSEGPVDFELHSATLTFMIDEGGKR